MESRIDHFLWGAPDLEDGMRQIEALTGVAPRFGGTHPGVGTRNALMSLGEDIYFEVIAPDPAQSLEGNLGGELAGLPEPLLLTMALRADDPDTVAEIYGAHGIETMAVDMSRDAPEGDRLAWSLCIPADEITPLDPRRPFYIDWKDTPHPAGAAPGGCQFAGVRFITPDAEQIAPLWEALGLPLRPKEGSRHALILDLDTPNGRVTLEGER